MAFTRHIHLDNYYSYHINIYGNIHGHLNLIEEVCLHSSQDTAAAEDLTLRVEAQIVADLLEDEYFNFSVRLHAS